MHGLVHFHLGFGSSHGQDLQLVELSVETLVHIAYVFGGRIKCSRQVPRLSNSFPPDSCTSYGGYFSSRPRGAEILSIRSFSARSSSPRIFRRHLNRRSPCFFYGPFSASVCACTCHLRAPLSVPYKETSSSLCPPVATRPHTTMAHHHDAISSHPRHGVYFTSSNLTMLDLPKWLAHDNPPTPRENQPAAESAISFTRQPVSLHQVDPSMSLSSQEPTQCHLVWPQAQSQHPTDPPSPHIQFQHFLSKPPNPDSLSSTSAAATRPLHLTLSLTLHSLRSMFASPINLPFAILLPFLFYSFSCLITLKFTSSTVTQVW